MPHFFVGFSQFLGMQRYFAGLKLHWTGYQNCIRFKPVLPVSPIQLVDKCYFLYSSKPLAYVLIWCPVLTPCLILTDAFQMSLYYIIMRHVLYLAVLMQLLQQYFWKTDQISEISIPFVI